MAGRSVSQRRTALRRYPALGYLAGVGALALLLPSGLTLPQSGPPTLAEYAPVPGQGQGQSDQGELGAPSTGGLGGFGPGDGFGAPPPSLEPEIIDVPEGGGGQARPAGTKRCVGKPPRQTEDPLSPPCIAFFEGDNFGATAKGVTRDAVLAVLTVDFNASTNTQDRERGPRLVDCDGPVREDDNTSDHFCRGFMRYFNDRYQTYNRRVRLFANHGLKPAEVDERLGPFAFVSVSPSADAPPRGMIGVGYQSQERAQYRQFAPYFISFRPDNEDAGAIIGSFVCNKLHDRNVSFTDDIRLAGKPRVFGYWHPDPISSYDEDVLAGLKRYCGLEIKHFAAGYNDETAATRLQAEGVTTVILSPNIGNTAHALVTKQATAATWFPEWVIAGGPAIRDINTNFYGRLADPAQWRNAIGVTFDYRRPALTDQTWYRAYREGCPTCPPTSATGASSGAHLYDALSMLFWGIQAAGPRLNAANLDRGLHAIPPQGSPNPYKPAAYFAPGNYTFVKDAAAIWWDASGVAPGSGSQGCYRLPYDGKRRRAGEWPEGHDDVRRPGPCQGDPF